jgi:hypothetical protein
MTSPGMGLDRLLSVLMRICLACYPLAGNSASILAAHIKSFSESPPMACVL